MVYAKCLFREKVPPTKLRAWKLSKCRILLSMIDIVPPFFVKMLGQVASAFHSFKNDASFKNEVMQRVPEPWILLENPWPSFVKQ